MLKDGKFSVWFLTFELLIMEETVVALSWEMQNYRLSPPPKICGNKRTAEDRLRLSQTALLKMKDCWSLV